MGRVLPFAELFDMALAALRGLGAVCAAEGIVDLGQMGEGGAGGKGDHGCKAQGGWEDDFFRHGKGPFSGGKEIFVQAVYQMYPEIDSRFICKGEQ